MTDTVIFIATYNERENVTEMVRQLEALEVRADIVFLDDGSPDGTGELLDALASEREQMHVIHRPGKQGIGSAHQVGIRWAYEQGYRRLITLDCDFSHSPSDIPRLLEVGDGYDAVVGSRWARRGSLPGWSPHRVFLTMLGRALTRLALGIPHDATGSFRLYNLDRIPLEAFDEVESEGYSFFFESMYVLCGRGLRIHEVPIVLPVRTYGHSKMTLRDILQSLRQAQTLFAARLTSRARRAPPRTEPTSAEQTPSEAWDDYWGSKSEATHLAYDGIAGAYRRLVIRPRLNAALRKHFSPGSRLLHAGCGSGEVDEDVQSEMELTAVDISPLALERYAQAVPRAARVDRADVLDLPYPDGSFDGAYNLGVIEHFSSDEVRRHLRELARVVRPGGKIVLFWPHSKATSVFVLGAAHTLLDAFGKQGVRLHPPEISLLGSKAELEELVAELGLELADYYFGPRDFFVQATVVLLNRRNLGS